METTFSRRKICISDIYLKSCFWAWYTIRVDHQSWPDSVILRLTRKIPLESAKNVLVKGIGEKRQITPTFLVSAFGDFQPTRLNCKGNTRRCFLSFLFPRNFNMTFTKNHWSKHRECWAFFFYKKSFFF